MSTEKTTYITKPLLPEILDFVQYIEQIWDTRQVTNMGSLHNQLEIELKDILKTSNISLFNNGTIALLTAIKALDLPAGSEVITTPFTFAATPHCISWNGLTPVFCDIEAEFCTIDPQKIEAAITPQTSAILGVHVYGCPCYVKSIDEIARKHNLKVIYDAAHAFTSKIDGVDIGNYGDITMFSFHATKLFNTIEGGCLTYNQDDMNKKIHDLRNFGIKSEEMVENIGINGKLNEIQSAIGLLNLKIFEEEKEKRKKVKDIYNAELSPVDGIRIINIPGNATDSYQYYPIVLSDAYPLSRNELYDKLKENNILSRKYFYPLCSDYLCYKDLPSSSPENLPVANSIKNNVLCLPLYGDLPEEIIYKIIRIIKEVI